VLLTSPPVALRRLIRERVLTATRRALGCDRHGPGFHVAQPSVQPGDVAFAEGQDVDQFAGRLLSEQHLLAAHRAGEWGVEQVHAAMDRALDDGLAQVLDLLHELDDLDETAWRTVVAVHRAIARRRAAS